MTLGSDTQIIFCSYAKHIESLASATQAKILETSLRYFTGMEFLVTLPCSCEHDIYIAQSFGLNGMHDGIIELLLTIDAARNAGARTIHIILPYIPYSRQDRMLEPYSSFGLQAIANLLNNSEVDSLTTFDMHSPESIFLFKMPIVNISGIEIVKAHGLDVDKLIVAPDHGGLKRHNTTTHFTKKRDGTNLTLELHGDVAGQRCLIVDDIIDTGRTICMAAETLMQNGAKSVEVFATHAFFSEATCKLIDTSTISRITVSNSIAHDIAPKVIEIIDIANIIAYRQHPTLPRPPGWE